MIFIIDNCFASNHKEECIILKSKTFSIEEMTNLVGALGNLFFRSTNEHICPPNKIMNILCDTFECKDRKHKFLGEMEFIERRIQSPMLHATFVLHGEYIVWMDISEAMDYTFGGMNTILGEYFDADEIKEIIEEWKNKK